MNNNDNTQPQTPEQTLKQFESHIVTAARRVYGTDFDDTAQDLRILVWTMASDGKTAREISSAIRRRTVDGIRKIVRRTRLEAEYGGVCNTPVGYNPEDIAVFNADVDLFRKHLEKADAYRIRPRTSTRSYTAALEKLLCGVKPEEADMVRDCGTYGLKVARDIKNSTFFSGYQKF
jgi:hypothetical protein